MSILDDEAEWCREQLKAAKLWPYKCTCWILHTEECNRQKLQSPVELEQQEDA